MKAAVISTPNASPEFGGFTEPVAGKGREIVELVATGIHPIVRELAAGLHYGSSATWPGVPGVDAVARTSDGVLVYVGYAEPGTLAERMAIPTGMKIPLPEGADPIQVAGGLNPGLSSWLPLESRVSEVGKLGTVIVLGATGMAGLLAVQNALLWEANQVIGVGRNLDGLGRVATLGGLPVALTGDREVDAGAIRNALGDDDPSLVLDFVWGTPAEATFHALGRRGLQEDTADIAYVQIGSVAGGDALVPASLLRSRRIRLYGSGLGSTSVAKIREQIPAYMQLISNGRVHIPTRVFPLEEIAQAWAAAGTSGLRVVVQSR